LSAERPGISIIASVKLKANLLCQAVTRRVSLRVTGLGYPVGNLDPQGFVQVGMEY
jgi:hypothetical protein